jgi:hypothetical protein
MPPLAKKQTAPRALYPKHEYAAQHKAIRARDDLVTSRRRLRDAAELRPSGEVACERIREFGWDLGVEARIAHPNGWIATASRALGLHEATGWLIISGRATCVATATVDAVAKHTGVPVRIFYDPEL